MDKLDKKICIRYKEKNNPSWRTIGKLGCLKDISDLTMQFSTIRYFVERLCFANGYRDYLDYFNFPNLEVADDNSKLFLLKLYKIYELKKYKMFFIPVSSEKYKNLKYAYIYSSNADLNSLITYAFLQSIILQNNYKNLHLTKEDMIIIDSILISYEYKFEEEDNRWIIFNGFLRKSIETADFYKKLKQNITRETYEKALEDEFKQLKKNNRNFVSNMQKQFDLQFSSFIQKIHKFQQTQEYKKFHSYCIKTIKPFKFPLKQYFGKTKQIQYKCFHNLLEEFTKQYKNKS